MPSATSQAGYDEQTAFRDEARQQMASKDAYPAIAIAVMLPAR